MGLISFSIADKAKHLDFQQLHVCNILIPNLFPLQDGVPNLVKFNLQK